MVSFWRDHWIGPSLLADAFPALLSHVHPPRLCPGCLERRHLDPWATPAAHGASRDYAACPQLGTIAGLPLYLDADPRLHDNLLPDCLCYPPGKPLRRLRLV
jgi:hypothetical protein